MLESALWRCGTSEALKVRLAEFRCLCTTELCSVKCLCPKKKKKKTHGTKSKPAQWDYKAVKKKQDQPCSDLPFTVDSCMLMCYKCAGWGWLWFMSSASTRWEAWRFGCVLISMQSNACRDSRDLQRLQFSFSLYGRVLPDGGPDAVERSNLGYE